MIRGTPQVVSVSIGFLFGFAFRFSLRVGCSSFRELDAASAFCSASSAFGFLYANCVKCVFLEDWEVA